MRRPTRKISFSIEIDGLLTGHISIRFNSLLMFRYDSTRDDSATSLWKLSVLSLFTYAVQARQHYHEHVQAIFDFQMHRLLYSVQ